MCPGQLCSPASSATAGANNGLAGAAGAAAGPLPPAADRPFSRPAGRIPPRHNSPGIERLSHDRGGRARHHSTRVGSG
jgi:hypothetical protein